MSTPRPNSLINEPKNKIWDTPSGQSMSIWQNSARERQNMNEDGWSSNRGKSSNRPVEPWKTNTPEESNSWKNKKRQLWRNWRCVSKRKGGKRSKENVRRSNTIRRYNYGVSCKPKKIQSISNTTTNSCKIKTLCRESTETRRQWAKGNASNGERSSSKRKWGSFKKEWPGIRKKESGGWLKKEIC